MKTYGQDDEENKVCNLSKNTSGKICNFLQGIKLLTTLLLWAICFLGRNFTLKDTLAKPFDYFPPIEWISRRAKVCSTHPQNSYIGFLNLFLKRKNKPHKRHQHHPFFQRTPICSLCRQASILCKVFHEYIADLSIKPEKRGESYEPQDTMHTSDLLGRSSNFPLCNKSNGMNAARREKNTTTTAPSRIINVLNQTQCFN